MSDLRPSRRRYRQPSRPGHLGFWRHLGVYLVLLVLVAADYVLLRMSLLMLNRGASTQGSIGLEMYLIAAGFSVMMIVLPHVAAVVGKRLADGLLHKKWAWMLAIVVIVWVGILALVTTMRIVASATSSAPTAAEIALGAEPTAGGVDWLSPDSLMALLTAFFLTATGIASFVVTWLTTRPLLHAVEKAEQVEHRMREERDAADVALKEAEAELAVARIADGVDQERLAMVKEIVSERLSRLRAEIATLIAEHESDPRITSHLIRELNARRDRLAVLPRPDLEDAG